MKDRRTFTLRQVRRALKKTRADISGRAVSEADRTYRRGFRGALEMFEICLDAEVPPGVVDPLVPQV